MKNILKIFLANIFLVTFISCEVFDLEVNQNLSEKVGDVSCVPNQHDGLIYYTSNDSATQELEESSFEYNGEILYNENNLITGFGEGNYDYPLRLKYMDNGLMESYKYTSNYSERLTEATYKNETLTTVKYNGKEGRLNEGDFNDLNGIIELEIGSTGGKFQAELADGEIVRLRQSAQSTSNHELFEEWEIQYSSDTFKSQNEKILFYHLILRYDAIAGFALLLSGNQIPSTVIYAPYGSVYNFEVEYNSDGYITRIEKDDVLQIHGVVVEETTDIFDYSYICQ